MTEQATKPVPPGAGNMGYMPLRLTLIGFKGIRSGLGRDTLNLDLEPIAAGAVLVALSGANGRGKSTVMDNLHPLC